MSVDSTADVFLRLRVRSDQVRRDVEEGVKSADTSSAGRNAGATFGDEFSKSSGTRIRNGVGRDLETGRLISGGGGSGGGAGGRAGASFGDEFWKGFTKKINDSSGKGGLPATLGGFGALFAGGALNGIGPIVAATTGAVTGLAGAFAASGIAAAAYGAVAKPVLTGAETAAKAAEKAHTAYTVAIANGTPKAKAFAAEQKALSLAYANMSPQQIALSKQLGAMADSWDAIKAKSTPVVAGSIRPWLAGITATTKVLPGIIARVAPAVGSVGTAFDRLMTSQTTKDFAQFIGGTGGLGIRAAGGTVIDLLKSFMIILPQFNPLIKDTDRWIAGIGPAVLKWASSKRTADDITHFMAWFKENGPGVKDLFVNLGGALKALAPGLASSSMTEIHILSDFLGWVARLPPSVAKPLLDIAGALLLLNKFGVLKVGVKIVGAAAKWLAGGAIDIGGGGVAAAEMRAAMISGGTTAAAEMRAAMASGGAAAAAEEGAGAAGAGATMGEAATGSIAAGAAGIGTAIAGGLAIALLGYLAIKPQLTNVPGHLKGLGTTPGAPGSPPSLAGNIPGPHAQGAGSWTPPAGSGLSQQAQVLERGFSLGQVAQNTKLLDAYNTALAGGNAQTAEAVKSKKQLVAALVTEGTMTRTQAIAAVTKYTSTFQAAHPAVTTVIADLHKLGIIQPTLRNDMAAFAVAVTSGNKAAQSSARKILLADLADVGVKGPRAQRILATVTASVSGMTHALKSGHVPFSQIASDLTVLGVKSPVAAKDTRDLAQAIIGGNKAAASGDRKRLLADLTAVGVSGPAASKIVDGLTAAVARTNKTAASGDRKAFINDLVAVGVKAPDATKQVDVYTSAVSKNGASTAAARGARQQMIDDAVKAGMSAASATRLVDAYTVKIEENHIRADQGHMSRRTLVADLEAAGLNARQAAAYANNYTRSLNAIPKDERTNMTLSATGVWSVSEAGAAQKAVKTAGTALKAAAGAIHFGTGGVAPGYAPGVDSIPVWASPGEGFIVPEAVRGLGGPQAIDAINYQFAGHRGAGAPGFARGGVLKIPPFQLGAWTQSHWKGVHDDMIATTQAQMLAKIAALKAAAAAQLAAGPAGGAGGSTMANGAAVYDYLLKYVFSGNKIAAAGATASIWGESTWNPFAQGTGGRGLIGWTPPGTISDAAFKGGLRTQLPAVIDFIRRNGDQGVINQMMGAQTISQAAWEWGRGVERFGIPDVHPEGLRLAEQISHQSDLSLSAGAAAKSVTGALKSVLGGIHLANGGRITSGTTETADDVLVRASLNETVLSAEQSRFLAPVLSAMGVRGYAAGGRIGNKLVHQRLSPSQIAAAASSANLSAGETQLLALIAQEVSAAQGGVLTAGIAKSDAARMTALLNTLAKYFDGGSAKRLEAAINSQSGRLENVLIRHTAVGQRIGQISGFAGSVTSNIAGFASLSGLQLPATSALGGAGKIIGQALNNALRRLRLFAHLISLAKQRRLSMAFIQQAIALGPGDGASYLQEVLQGGSSVIRTVNDAFTAISAENVLVGQVAANTVYGQSGTGKNFLHGLKAQQRDLNAVAVEMAKAFAREVDRAFAHGVAVELSGGGHRKTRVLRKHAYGGNIPSPMYGLDLSGDVHSFAEWEGERVVPRGSDPLLDELRAIRKLLGDAPGRTAAGVAKAVKAPAGQEAMAARWGAR